MSDQGNIRNLEQIEECDESDRRMPHGVTMALVALGGACVVFAGFTLGGRTSAPVVKKADPLGDLVSLQSRGVAAAAAGASRATDLSPKDVTFPQMLSDEARPSTALAAVRPLGSSPVAPVPSRPPPPTDRLPVVPVAPLPAQAVLEATALVTRPRDAMTKAATEAGQVDSAGESAPAGHEGGYQLQVSSFRAQGDAQGFADQLRARGHKAYVAEAHVVGRGTWFRVRIGPFTTQRAASQYRTSFEAREHVVPFIVPPETTAKAH